MVTRAVSRRGMLQVLAAAGVATVGAESIASVARAAPGDASGTVTAIPPFATIGTVSSSAGDKLVVQADQGSLTVVPQPNARMYSGAVGDVASMAAFIVGDRVFVAGEVLGDGTISASTVGSVYENLAFQVVFVDPARKMVRTDKGNLRLDGRLPGPRQPSHQLLAGTSATGTTWRDPRNQDSYLLLADSDSLS